jgi:hypothetical protein
MLLRSVRMPEVRPTQHAGLDAVEMVEGGVRMVLVHEIGPRIASFGLLGRASLLYWDEAGAHRHGDFRLYGGHRLWTTRPDADESEETFAPDNAPCAVLEVEGGVEVIAPPTPSRIEKALRVTARGPTWTVEHRLRNVGTLLWAGGAWTLTCTLPAAETRYRIPLGGGSPEWDVLTMVIPRRWAGHTSRVDDPQFVLREDAIELRALGDEAKRMVHAPRGVIEMIDEERGLFTKTATLRSGTYPRDTNLAVYLGPRAFMVEMESMSPFAALAPGEQLVHTETWTLRA